MPETPIHPGRATRLPHLLYVAWGYPPSRGAGMYRALATANAFARNGWRVTVLTATRDTFDRMTGSDPEAERAIDPSINVVRIPFDAPIRESDLRKWSRWRAFSPLLWNYLHTKRASGGFPEPRYSRWVRPLTSSAEQIHRKDPVSLVIGSANPNVDFMPGHHLHRKFSVPYVMDYRDAWTLDVYTGERVGDQKTKASRLERKLISAATEAWFVNEPIRNWHANEYPASSAKFHVVANGFDPEFLDASLMKARNGDNGLVFGYLGTIYGPIPLREALEGWRLARELSPIVGRSRLVFRGQLGHFVEADEASLSLFEEFREDAVTYEGPVSKTKVSAVYGGFDALLLIVSRSPFITSGKVFEYAATGLPIASLHHPETAATTVLEGRPGWFPASIVSADEFARVIVEAGKNAASSTRDDVLRAQRWSGHLAREEQLNPRVLALSRAVADRLK